MANLSYSQTRKMRKIIGRFALQKGTVDIIESFGNGRINRTFKITIKSDDKRYEYLLQNINHYVFYDTKGLMENVTAVTEHIRENCGRSLQYIKCKTYTEESGPYIFIDEDGNHWRMYHYIDADVYPCVIDSHHAYMLGEAIAEFSSSVDGFDTSKLIDTIPDFHDTPKRFHALLVSIALDVVNGTKRSDTVKEMISFVTSREKQMGVLMDALEAGEIPYRVVHNDPKISNVLFDKETNAPICMIDPDTIMRGTTLFDVGDALRSIANTASEDDKTTDNVSFSKEIFEEFVKGYIKGMNGKLTKKEIELIPISIWVLAMELGIRFLKDHIDGNVYFKTDYDGQNIERADVQFALAKCIEAELSAGSLQNIVKNIVEGHVN